MVFWGTRTVVIGAGVTDISILSNDSNYISGRQKLT